MGHDNCCSFGFGNDKAGGLLINTSLEDGVRETRHIPCSLDFLILTVAHEQLILYSAPMSGLALSPTTRLPTLTKE